MDCSPSGFSLSMGFSRQKCWSGLPFPSPEDLPDPGTKPASTALQTDSLPSEPPGKPNFIWEYCCLVAQSCPTLCNPRSCGTPGFPVLHYLPEFAQTYVHWVEDAIQPSHPLSLPSPPVLNLSKHQGLFRWISSLHQVIKVLEHQHQCFQWMFRVDFL